jgi:hypothetical protein
LVTAWRAIKVQGITGSYRRAYWRFLRWVLRHHPAKLGRAIAQAAAGHHYIVYTRDVVVPALMESAAAVQPRPAIAESSVASTAPGS